MKTRKEQSMIKLDFSRSKLRTQSIVEYNDKIIQYDKELEKEAKNNGCSYQKTMIKKK